MHERLHERAKLEELVDALRSIADHDKEYDGLEDAETMVAKMRDKAIKALKDEATP